MFALALLCCAPAATAGCASDGSPASSVAPHSSREPSSVAEAYDSAHPTGGLPASLQAVDLSRNEAGRRLAAVVADGVRIVLPLHLPQGYGPAAPYIAVGDGSARPNPESWGRSYRVSYTDGRGLIVMTVGAAALPGGVVWGDGRLLLDGRVARAGRAGDQWVVATVEARPRVLVTALNVARVDVLGTARSLARWP